MKKLRVLNVIEDGRVAGPQSRIVRVAEGMKGQIETVVLMPTRDSDQFAALCNQAEVKFRKVSLVRPEKTVFGILLYILCFPLDVWRLCREIRRGNIDIVHVSGGSWQIKAIIAAKIASKPSIWHLNDTYVPSVIRLIFRALRQLPTAYIFASHRTLEYYGPIVDGSKLSCVIPSGVNTDYFSPETAGDKNNSLGDYRTLVIGTVASLNPVKSIEMLLYVAKLLTKTGIDFEVRIVGPILDSQKSYYEKLTKLIEQLELRCVRFLGATDDVRPYLAEFDIYLCTSRFESSPTAVWEAMAMGKAVVSTNVGDVDVHLHDGENGYIVQVDDFKTMAERVESLLSNPSVRNELGMRARDSINSVSLDTVVTLTADFYQDVYDSRC